MDQTQGSLTYISAVLQVDEDFLVRLLIFILIAVGLVLILIAIGVVCFKKSQERGVPLKREPPSKELSEEEHSNISNMT